MHSPPPVPPFLSQTLTSQPASWVLVVKVNNVLLSRYHYVYKRGIYAVCYVALFTGTQWNYGGATPGIHWFAHVRAVSLHSLYNWSWHISWFSGIYNAMCSYTMQNRGKMSKFVTVIGYFCFSKWVWGTNTNGICKTYSNLPYPVAIQTCPYHLNVLYCPSVDSPSTPFSTIPDFPT